MMRDSLLKAFMPYCIVTKGECFALLNRDYDMVFSGVSENTISLRNMVWISDGLKYEQWEDVFRFFLYEGDPESLSHPEYPDMDGRKDPVRIARYFLRLNRLIEVLGSVEKIEESDSRFKDMSEIIKRFNKKC